jgi:hypothetical protein
MRLAIALFLLLLSGCYVISYSYPDGVERRGAAKREATLYWHVNRVPQLTLGGAEDQLKASMRDNPVFAHSIEVEKAPAQGLYIEVRTQEQEMSALALVWGYISISTAHLLPAYSGSGGFNVRFYVYQDGQEKRIYEYPVRRKIVAWLPLVAFAWVNLFTDSESDAMAATTDQFFADALRDRIF